MTAEALVVPVRRSRPLHARPSSAALPIGVVRWALGSTALLAGWLVLFATVVSGLQETRTQHVLYAELRQRLAEATAPVGAPVAPGAPVALITAPGLGLDDAVVVQGTSGRELMAGPGHWPDTVLPGQVGVSVLYGRSGSFGGPFGRLAELRQGDRLTVTTGQGRVDYTVTGLRHAGDPVGAPAAGTGRLTLVSTEGDGALGRWAPRRTVLVDAVAAKPFPAGAVAGAREVDAPLASDTGALVPLVLWLEGLLAVALAGVWATRRWGVPQTWLVVGPAAVACAWGASGAVWALVPNLV